MLRLDDLENGHVIWQDPDMFCFGVDAVLLAHFPKLRDGDRILDLGTGFAPIPLIISAEAKKSGIRTEITGLEIQEKACEIAELSVKENGLEEEIRIVKGDIREVGSIVRPASFSLVLSNPPYMAEKCGLVGAFTPKAIARTELLCTLRDVIRAAAHALMPGGRFAMIHRPARLPEIFEEMRSVRIEPKRLRFVHPYADAEPAMVLVEGVRGGKPYLRAEAPLVIYRSDRSYTDELLEIYGKKREA